MCNFIIGVPFIDAIIDVKSSLFNLEHVTQSSCKNEQDSADAIVATSSEHISLRVLRPSTRRQIKFEPVVPTIILLIPLLDISLSFK